MQLLRSYPLVPATAALLCFLGCASSQTSAWITHQDPHGFRMQVPRGWNVAFDAASGRVNAQGPAREQVTIWPVFALGGIDPRGASAVLARLAAAGAPGMLWGGAQPLGATALRALGRSPGRVALATFTWVNSPRGSAGYLYVTAAPETAYRRNEETFFRILSSFRATGAPEGKTQAPSIAYTRFQDPRENAFSLDYPTGWNATGGLFRMAPVDTRSAWEIVSPDGQIRITGGDAQLPTFTEPNQMLMMTGFREGSWYSPGYGVNMLVRRYTPGPVFVREYVGMRPAQGCAALNFTQTRDRSDASAQLNAIYDQFSTYGVAMRMSAGDAAFTCRKNDQEMAGYYFAAVLRTQTANMPGGLWHVEHLVGYLAPRAREAEAKTVMEHVIASIQVNPQWMSMQQSVTANTSRIVSRTQSEISNIISSTFNNRQTVMDEISRKRSNATLGVVDVVDPATGYQTKVESGSNYYWMDNRGTIVGTQTDTLPNLDFRALTRLP